MINIFRSYAERDTTADIFADCMLLWIPMRLFRSIMSRNLRKRLMVIFSTCIMTTIVSLVHASFILVSGGPREIMAAIIEVFVNISKRPILYMR